MTTQLYDIFATTSSKFIMRAPLDVVGQVLGCHKDALAAIQLRKAEVEAARKLVAEYDAAKPQGVR